MWYKVILWVICVGFNCACHDRVRKHLYAYYICIMDIIYILCNVHTPTYAPLSCILISTFSTGRQYFLFLSLSIFLSRSLTPFLLFKWSPPPGTFKSVSDYPQHVNRCPFSRVFGCSIQTLPFRRPNGKSVKKAILKT